MLSEYGARRFELLMLSTCNFSSLFVFDAFVFALLLVCNGEPGAMHAGAETRRSQ